MIREHDFNSRWWGAPVGIVSDAAFFSLSPEERAPALSVFEWVEFKAAVDEAPSPAVLQAAGFFQVDVQMNFRLNLRKVRQSESIAALQVRTAAERPLSITGTAFRPFDHERFRYVPGATQSRIDERFSLWSADLIQKCPEYCLEVVNHDVVQGWFLSQRHANHGLNLTLAMLHVDATISGMLLYQKACHYYAQQGERVGWASFSADHTAVLNIYAAMGAGFIAPTYCWLWTPSSNE